MTTQPLHYQIAVGILLLLGVPSALSAQEIFDVNVTVQANEDPLTGLFIYNYTVSNSAQSTQSVEIFRIETNARATVQDIESPEGWSAMNYATLPVVGWAATGGIPDVPESDPSFGDIQPSPFQIAPGQSLSGFRFKSSLPAVEAVFLASPFVDVPEVSDVDDLPPEDQRSFIETSVQGATSAPGTDPACNPLGGDSDVDGVCEFEDNCPFVANASQVDSGGLSGSSADFVGDVCQCGDVSGDGILSGSDVDVLSDALIGIGTASPDKCSIAGTDDCDLVDLVVLRRSLEFGRPLELLQSCPATRP